MKRKSRKYRFLFLANSVVAVLLSLSVFGKYIAPTRISAVSPLSLLVPLFIVLNWLFLVFWLFIKRRYVFVSAAVLLLAFLSFGTFYKVGGNTTTSTDKGFKIMTFNARGFNVNQQIDAPKVDTMIVDFINREDPDIVCIQESTYYFKGRPHILSAYPYQYVDFEYLDPSHNVILAFFSKYPLVDSLDIDFPKSSNRAMYLDVVKDGDTMRIFNVHLESFKINPEVDAIQSEDSKKLLGRLQNTFVKQKRQVDIIKKHIDSTRYPTLVVGDFNSTQFSYNYHVFEDDFQDSFLEAGSGFGRTYDLKGFPVRIDYILADDNFEILAHRNYDEKLSDHFPVMATLKLKSDK